MSNVALPSRHFFSTRPSQMFHHVRSLKEVNTEHIKPSLQRRNFGERVLCIFLVKIMAAIFDFYSSVRLGRERNSWIKSNMAVWVNVHEFVEHVTITRPAKTPASQAQLRQTITLKLSCVVNIFFERIPFVIWPTVQMIYSLDLKLSLKKKKKKRKKNRLKRLLNEWYLS